MTSLASTIGGAGFASPLNYATTIEPEPDAPSLMALAGDAINSEWLVSNLHRAFTTHLGTLGMVDPGYDPLEEREWERLTDGIDSTYWEELAYSKGAIHGSQIRDNILSRQASRQRLAEAGLTGVALTLGANIVDPLTLAVGAATGGVGAVGTKATRLQRFVRYGIASAAVDTPLESIRAVTDPDSGVTDVALSVLGSFALGGGIGLGADAITRRLQEASVKDAGRIMEDEVRRAYDVGAGVGAASPHDPAFAPTPFREHLEATYPQTKWSQFFRHDMSDKEVGRAIDKFAAHNGLMAEEVEDLRATFKDRELYDAFIDGSYPPRDAAGEGSVTTPLEASEGPTGYRRFDPIGNSTEEARWGKVRYSYSSQLTQKGLPEDVRWAGNSLVEDAVLKPSGAPQGVDAYSWTHQNIRGLTARYYRTSRAAWGEFATVLGEKGRAARDRFNNQLSRYIYDENFEVPKDGAMGSAVREARDAFARIGEVAKDHGVLGFEDFTPNQHYLPVIWSKAKMNDAVATFGRANVQDFFYRVYKQADPEMDDKVAKLIARNQVDVALRIGDMNSVEASRILNPENVDILREAIGDKTDLDRETIDDIIARLSAQEPTQTNRARKRFTTNEMRSLRGDIENPATGIKATMTLNDFLENDVDRLVQRYAHDVIGMSASNMVYKRLTERMGLDSPILTHSQFVRRLDESMRKAKVNESLRKRTLDRFDKVGKLVRGQPVETDSQFNRGLELVRKFNMGVLGGGMGVAQAPETGAVIGEYTLGVFIDNVPELGQMFRKAYDGKVDSDILATIEDLWGAGTDSHAHQIWSRHEVGSLLEDGGSRVNNALTAFSDFTAKAGGMTVMNEFLQKFAHLGAMNRLARLSLDGRNLTDAGGLKISKGLRRTLASIGMDDATSEKVLRAIKHEATRDGGGITTEPGLFGPKIKRLSVDKWEDQDAAAQFVNAVGLWARKTVPERNLGSLNGALGTSLGKSIFQFQTFHMMSWEKRMLNGIANSDWNTYTGMTISAFIGSLVYIAQMHANAVGRTDKEAYLKKSTGVENIADQFTTRQGLSRMMAAGIQRGGFASLLPQAIDTVAVRAMGYDPIFDARNTGLSSIVLDPRNNPTTALLDDAFGVAKGFTSLAPGDNRHLSQSDMRAITKLGPWATLPGLRNLREMAISQFPEDER